VRFQGEHGMFNRHELVVGQPDAFDQDEPAPRRDGRRPASSVSARLRVWANTTDHGPQGPVKTSTGRGDHSPPGSCNTPQRGGASRSGQHSMAWRCRSSSAPLT
jgi:hypothetical protein